MHPQPLSSAKHMQPFLTAYASLRTTSTETPGYYSAEQDMWVVNVDGIAVPLIEAEKAVSELTTKTRTEGESDDQSISSFTDLVTKTMTNTEQDDDSRNTSISLELATKTEAELEHDDTSPSTTALFL